MESQKKEKFNLKRLLITIGIVLLTAAVVGGTTWYVMEQQVRENKDSYENQILNLQSLLNELRESSEAGTGEMSDWKKYENMKFGFSFEYPQDWLEYLGDQDDNRHLIKSLKSPDFTVSDRGIVIKGEMMKIYVESPSTQTWQQIIDGGFGLECSEIVKDEKSTKIDGAKTWILQVYSNIDCDINPGIVQSSGRVIILTDSNNQIMINYTGKDKSTLTNLDKILSTFSLNSGI